MLASCNILLGRRDIQALQVMCINVSRKCAWEGTVEMLEDHVDSCRFSLVTCPNQCTDIMNHLNHFAKKDLGDHLKNDCPNRDTECQYCNLKGRADEIQAHDKICEKKVVSCPDIACSKTRRREEMEAHIKRECLFTVIPCKFQDIGCNRKMRRKDMAAHEQNFEFHTPMALNALVEMRETVAGLKGSVIELKNSVVDLLDTVVKIQDVNVQLKQFQRQEKTAPVTFSVSNYLTKKENDQKFTSPPFYTSLYGYRMAVRVFANGDGEGRDTHMSVCAPILEGKYDSGLQWPFIGSITFTLLNQLEDKNHYSHTTTLNTEHKAIVGVDWGKPKFILQSKLAHDKAKNTEYLKDDTLYFRVSVDVSGHKPWLECASSII